MDKSGDKSNGFIAILSLIFFLFGLPCWAATSEKPGVVRKKIHRTIESTEKTTPQRSSGNHLEKMSLSPKSDISTPHRPAGKNRIHAAKPKNDHAARPPYHPEGKVDPFKPLFSTVPEKHAGPPEPVVDRPEKPTVIENFDLSQLKLTGVLLAKSGNKGLVREPAGKGHIVKIGTYIGTCGGKVVTILSDKLIVEEKWKDYAGNVGIQRKEMRLIKNTGKL